MHSFLAILGKIAARFARGVTVALENVTYVPRLSGDYFLFGSYYTVDISRANTRGSQLHQFSINLLKGLTARRSSAAHVFALISLAIISRIRVTRNSATM